MEHNNVEIFEQERASKYDQFVDIWIPNYKNYLEMLPKILRQQNDKNLLIVGCGTGNEIQGFLDAEEDWIIRGIDPSPEMINQAIQKYKNYSNVHFEKKLVQELLIEDIFSAATLSLVLHFLPDNGAKENILKEIAAPLTPGAPFILLDITGEESQIVKNLNILKDLLPTTIPQEEILFRLDRIKNDLFIISEDRLSSILLAAEFESPTRFFQSTIYSGWITYKK